MVVGILNICFHRKIQHFSGIVLSFTASNASSSFVCICPSLYDTNENVCNPDRCFQLDHAIYRMLKVDIFSCSRMKFTIFAFLFRKNIDIFFDFLPRNMPVQKCVVFQLIFLIYKCQDNDNIWTLTNRKDF